MELISWRVLAMLVAAPETMAPAPTAGHRRATLGFVDMARTEIACGPINGSQVLQEIPFVCSLFTSGGGPEVGAMYGVGCSAKSEDLWNEFKIPTAIIQDCVRRWLSMGYRVLRTGDAPAASSDWREIHSIAEAVEGM